MSIGIGNSISFLPVAPYSLNSGPHTSSAQAPKVGFGQASSAATAPKAGFGENTLSISAAALQALSHTIEGAKDLVVALQEVHQERRRQQQAEQAAETTPAYQAATPPKRASEEAPETAVFQRPEAAPQAPAFLDGNGDTAPATVLDVASEPQDQSLVGTGTPQGLLTTNTLNLLI